MKPRNSSRASLLLSATLLFTHSAQADLTWDNGAATGNWNISDSNFTGVAWSDGNTAIFGGPANSTIDINAGAVSATGLTFNVGGDTITASSGSITLTGTPVINTGLGLTSTINANINSAVGMAVETTPGTGTGTLNLGGLTTLSSAGDLVIGGTASSTANNTLNLASGGRLLFTVNNWVRLGGSAGSGSNGNKLNVSTPGSNASRSMQIGNLDIGNTTSGNEMKVSNGAYVVREATLSGQATWNLGLGVGGDNNRLIVTGAGSVATMKGTNTLRQFLKVGVAGSGNYVQVDSGGKLAAFRANIGGDDYVGGGDNNYILIKDSSSVLEITDSQAIFTIGNSPGATGNSLRIENGATGTFSQTQTSRTVSIGGGTKSDLSIKNDGSNNNYVLVKGAGSALNITHSQPVTIGGQVYSGVVYDSNTAGNTATGNHIDVQNGGSLNLAATTSLYVMGVNSAFNIGDGNALSTASVGSNGGAFTAGVYLKNSDGRLNFNKGKLTAGATGDLVSGAGKIDLLGNATVSTTFSSTIGTVIEDSTLSGGTFTKEGSGTLILTNTNTYDGTTTVGEGTLLINGANNGIGAVNVDADATLGGIGSIVGAVNVTGVLSPGASVETLASGALTFNDSSSFVYEVDSSVEASVGGDLQKVAGNLTLNGTVTLTLEDIAVLDTVFAPGTKFSLINYTGTWDGGLFTFDGNELINTESFTAGLNTWEITYNDPNGGLNYNGQYAGGSDSFVNIAIAIPEPASALLGGLGLLTLLRRRRDA